MEALDGAHPLFSQHELGSLVDLLRSGGVGCYSMNENYIDYDSQGTDEDDIELVNARTRLSEEKKKEKSYEEEMVMLKRIEESKGKNPNKYDDDFEGLSDLEDLDTASESSEDLDDYGYLSAPKDSGKRSKCLTQNAASSGDGSTFFVGQSFENAVSLRRAITAHSVQAGRNIVYSKNNQKQIGCHCKHRNKGCQWRLWASWGQGHKYFKVKTHVGNHTCGRQSRVKTITARWIAENFRSKFKVNPYMKIHDIIETIWVEKGLKVSRFMAYRARKLGQMGIIGDYEEQYSLLPRYASEIMKTNPGNTVKIKMCNNVFERMYVCFESLKLGFLGGCRRFISLDGCFLKGPFGGQLLVAVGRDGNNQMFPIAWSVVEVESTDSWTWFLDLLGTDLGTTEGAGYTFMSDQQKGLVAALASVFPSAETRVCARHVYCNFRAVFGGGLEMRRQFWIIAKSTTENTFLANIELMRGISNEAGDDLLNRNYKKWCRAFYSEMSSCDSVDNNMSEIFNAYILNSRHKPIITMLEDIREGLMERLHKKRDELLRKDIMLCPRIQHKLERNKIWARGWNSYWDGGFCYGVREAATQDKFVVNLEERTCSCRAWQLSGIPCKHVIVAVWNKGDQPESYVNTYFTKATTLKAYEHLLQPLNGPQEWPQSNGVVAAPKIKKIQHRPKNKRRLQQGEATASGKIRRSGTVIRCSLCGIQGHNKKGCKNVPSQNSGRQHPPPHQANTGQPQSAPSAGVSQPVQRAFYSDYNGEQSIYSFSQEYPVSSQQSQGRTTISTTRLQNLVQQKRANKN